MSAPGFRTFLPSKGMGRVSVIEYRPADVAAAGLVFQDEVAEMAGKLPALPIALFLACLVSLPSGRCGLNCLDGVGSGTKVVLRNMGNAGCLASGVRGQTSGSPQWARGTHGVPADRTGFHHLCLASSPSPRRFNSVTRPCVPAVRFLEQWQHMFGAGGRPLCQKSVVRIGKRPAPADGHEPRVTNSGKDHAATLRRLHRATAAL
jgi:hypothetical protein